jgi:hypothetical protein
MIIEEAEAFSADDRLNISLRHFESSFQPGVFPQPNRPQVVCPLAKSCRRPPSRHRRVKPHTRCLPHTLSPGIEYISEAGSAHQQTKKGAFCRSELSGKHGRSSQKRNLPSLILLTSRAYWALPCDAEVHMVNGFFFAEWVF